MPARMPILFVNTATLPPLGADTWIHAQIMSALDRATHELHAACASGSKKHPTPTFALLSKVPDLDIIRVNFGPELSNRSRAGKIRGLFETLPALWHVGRLAWFIRRKRIPVVHTSDRPRDAFVCVLLSRLTRAKCIIHVHVAYNESWMGRMLTWSVKHADAVVGVSDYVADTIVDGGIDRGKTFAVLNAIEVERWHPGEGRDEARREFDIPESAPVLITVCRLFKEKGPGELITALAEVGKEFPEVRLLVVGHEMATGYAQELVEMAASLGLARNVILTGRRGDVPKLMAAADVYAMPSFEEPFGLVFAEAMAMKLPVVALDNGGTREVVVNGDTGLLSMPGDTDALTSNILTLLRDPDLRRRMGERGRQHVEANFTTERMARDVAAVYRLVASGAANRCESEGGSK